MHAAVNPSLAKHIIINGMRVRRLAWDEEHMAFALCAGGRRKLMSSSVGGTACMKYVVSVLAERELGLIELLTDITTALPPQTINQPASCSSNEKKQTSETKRKTSLLHNCDVITNFMRSTDKQCIRHSTHGYTTNRQHRIYDVKLGTKTTTTKTRL